MQFGPEIGAENGPKEKEGAPKGVWLLQWRCIANGGLTIVPAGSHRRTVSARSARPLLSPRPNGVATIWAGHTPAIERWLTGQVWGQKRKPLASEVSAASVSASSPVQPFVWCAHQRQPAASRTYKEGPASGGRAQHTWPAAHNERATHRKPPPTGRASAACCCSRERPFVRRFAVIERLICLLSEGRQILGPQPLAIGWAQIVSSASRVQSERGQ